MKCKLCNLITPDKTFAPFCSSYCQMSYKALKDEFKRVKVKQKPIKRNQDYEVPVKRTLHRRKI